MKKRNVVGLMAALILAGGFSTQAADETPLDRKVNDTIDLFKQSDSKMQNLFSNSYGYAVFPAVGETAVGIGGAWGMGEVFDHGQLIGKVKLSEVTIGPQLGVQDHAEVIFFESRDPLRALKEEKFSVSAQTGVIAASEGAAAIAKYRRGVIVFAIPKTGLMFQANVGGQTFRYWPIAEPGEKTSPRG